MLKGYYSRISMTLVEISEAVMGLILVIGIIIEICIFLS